MILHCIGPRWKQCLLQSSRDVTFIQAEETRPRGDHRKCQVMQTCSHVLEYARSEIIVWTHPQPCIQNCSSGMMSHPSNPSLPFHVEHKSEIFISSHWASRPIASHAHLCYSSHYTCTCNTQPVPPLEQIFLAVEALHDTHTQVVSLQLGQHLCIQFCFTKLSEPATPQQAERT